MDETINIPRLKQKKDPQLFSEVTHRKHLGKVLSSLICRHYRAGMEQYSFHDDAKKQLQMMVCVQSDRLKGNADIS